MPMGSTEVFVQRGIIEAIATSRTLNNFHRFVLLGRGFYISLLKLLLCFNEFLIHSIFPELSEFTNFRPTSNLRPESTVAFCIKAAKEMQQNFNVFWCLNPREGLSPGQREEIDRVYAACPHLNDDAFVAAHRGGGWVRKNGPKEKLARSVKVW